MAKLTKEQKEAMHQDRCKEYEDNGYTVKDMTVSALRGNVEGMIIALPGALLLLVASRMIGKRIYPQMITDYNALGLLFMFILFIVLHELTHGAVAAIYCKEPKKSIRFGFNVEGLNPYFTCSEPLKVKHYRQVLLAPMLIEGVLPVIIGTLIGSYLLIVTGALMFWGAGGDLLIYGQLRKENKDDLVTDHPVLIGCTVLSKEE